MKRKELYPFHSGLSAAIDFSDYTTEIFFPFSSVQIGISKTGGSCFDLPQSSPEFGKKVARIIDGLTKISNVIDVSASQQAENFKKILLTLTDDPRVILIKLADRLHNMRTMDSMKREKQLKISSETVYVYAPLAHRMGLYNIKTEMEDLSMKYLELDAYKEIARKLSETKRERSRYINEFIKPIREKLEKAELNFEQMVERTPRPISSTQMRATANG